MVPPTLTVAGYPSHGRGVATRYGLDAELIVALGSASQTGFDTDYRLADSLLPSLLDAAAARNLARGYAEVVVELRGASTGEDDFGEHLPLMTALIASCRSGLIELSWVGNDKAYLVRGRRVLAESDERTVWRQAGAPTDPLAAEGRLALGVPTRWIDRQGCEPETLELRGVEPGDRLILISSALHTRVAWRSGVEEALDRADGLDASSLHRALVGIAEVLDAEVELAWAGPLVVVAF